MNMKTTCLAAIFGAMTLASGISSAATCTASLKVRGYDIDYGTGTYLIRTNTTLNTGTFITGTSAGSGATGTTAGNVARNRILSCWKNQFEIPAELRPTTCSYVTWGNSSINQFPQSYSLDRLALQNIAQGTPIHYNCGANDFFCYILYPNVPITLSKTTITISGDAGCSYTSTRYQYL